MTTKLKCGTCGGTYQPIQADGLRYFHACSPVYDPVAKVSRERPDRRDENIVVDGASRCVGIRAEGKGAVAVEVAPEL
jgi:hypothetical protein